MNPNSVIIDEIQKRSKITDYLSDRNIYPVRVSSEKSVYRCPLPNHLNDNTPSFCIFNKDDREDYFCFGCKKGGNLISFIVEYEGISFRDAISKLSLGLNIDLSDILDKIIEEVKNAAQGKIEDPKSVLQIVLYISSLCHDYFLKVDKSWKEVEVFEKMFKLCDNFMKSRDKKMLEELSELLPSFMGKRYKKYIAEKENDMKKEIVKWSNI